MSISAPTYFIARLPDTGDFALRAKIMQFFCEHDVTSQVFSNDVLFGQDAASAKRCGCYRGEERACAECSRRSAVTRTDYGSQTEDLISVSPPIPPSPLSLVLSDTGRSVSPLPFTSQPIFHAYDLDMIPQIHIHTPANDIDWMNDSESQTLTLGSPPYIKTQKQRRAERRASFPAYTRLPLSAQCTKCGETIHYSSTNTINLERHAAHYCSNGKTDSELAEVRAFYECRDCPFQGVRGLDMLDHYRVIHTDTVPGSCKANTRVPRTARYNDLFPHKGVDYLQLRARLLSLVIEHFPPAVDSEAFKELNEQTLSRKLKIDAIHRQNLCEASMEDARKKQLEKDRQARVERRKKEAGEAIEEYPDEKKLECKTNSVYLSKARECFPSRIAYWNRMELSIKNEVRAREQMEEQEEKD